MTAELVIEAAEFFDDFVAAFASFDGASIAQRYVTPYLALQGDGSLLCFQEHARIEEYFQRIVDQYRGEGCRSCRYKDLAVVALGRDSVLATVTWELLREDQTLLSSWRESYNLRRSEGQLRIFASVDHVGALA